MAEDKIKLEIEVPRKKLRQVIARQSRRESKTAEEKSGEDEEKTVIGGYEPAEILKAPTKTPEPADKEPPNHHQRRVIFFGFAVVLISPLLLFVNLTAFIIFALAGAIIVAFGSLVKV